MRHIRQSPPSRKSRQAPAGAATTMQGAFLIALARRAATHPAGKIILPTGPARARDVAKVLAALERARADGGRS